MKEKCSIVRMFGMFDWLKGALCLLSVAALCAFTGRAADPGSPLDPFPPFYSGGTVTNLGAVAAETSRNVLCEPDKPVKFSGVTKPSDAAGFFSIGARETPGVNPSDR